MGVVSNAAAADPPGEPPAGEGEACGGPGGAKCAPGLECRAGKAIGDACDVDADECAAGLECQESGRSKGLEIAFKAVMTLCTWTAVAKSCHLPN